MLSMEPRGIPIPAEPAFNVMREDIIGEMVPALPTVTVLTVPAVGGTSVVTWVAVVGVKRGTVTKLFHMPGCHIQP